MIPVTLSCANTRVQQATVLLQRSGYAYFQTQHRREALTGHGDKVLKLGAPHLLEKVPSQSLEAERIVSPADIDKLIASGRAPMRHRHYFSREALYRMVWTTPIMELAERLGVSDVGLAKLCRRAAIPNPPRGYWQRVETGQHIPATPLPPVPDGLPELLRIRGTKPLRHDPVASEIGS